MMNFLNLRRLLLVIGDLALVYFSLFVTLFVGFFGSFSWSLFSEHLVPFSILYVFWLIILYVFGFYDLNAIRSKFAFYPKALAAVLTELGVGMVFFYLVPFFGIAPKTNLTLNVLIFGVLFLIWRSLFYSLFSSHFQNKIAIVDDPVNVELLAKEIRLRPYLGYKLISLNTNENLLSQIKNKKIDTLVVPNRLLPDSWLTENLYQCLPARINFMDWIQAYELICRKVPVRYLAQNWFLENIKEGEKGPYDKIKRTVDIILAGVLLILSLPFWPLIALAVKLEDGGPVFYCQKRIGKDGKTFYLYKFRSMQKDAENETGVVWAKEKDSRVTRAGRILRRIHFDELPQIINVLKSDISLIGPRPERPEFIEKLEKEIPHYTIRHLIKPGLTGWAQIKFRYGRSVMDSREKFQYDLYYLKNRSLFLDLGILLKTLQLFLKN